MLGLLLSCWGDSDCRQSSETFNTWDIGLRFIVGVVYNDVVASGITDFILVNVVDMISPCGVHTKYVPMVWVRGELEEGVLTIFGWQTMRLCQRESCLQVVAVKLYFYVFILYIDSSTVLWSVAIKLKVFKSVLNTIWFCCKKVSALKKVNDTCLLRVLVCVGKFEKLDSIVLEK